MLALIALGYSLICVLLLNVGWGKRHIESWQRKCVFGAGWLSGIAALLCWGLIGNLSALLCTLGICALMFFGGLFEMSPRWMKRCSWTLFLGYWGWTAFQLVVLVPQYAMWREETPFESMEQRVPEPKHSSQPNRMSASSSDMTFLTHESYSRVQSIRYLHEMKLAEFNQAAGFGKIRMMVIHPLAEHFLPDAVQPIRQKLDHFAELVSTGANNSGLKDDSVAEMNAHSTVDFANPSGFGLVKSRTEVAGFRPHRFSEWPDAPKTWDVKRIDLVSLLLHDEPVVYVSNDLPRMADVGKLATRELDTFEKDGLAAIRKGDELYIRGDAEKLRVIGAMRNFDQCIKCHGGKDGDLLGAFSYVLVRQPTAK